MKQHLDKVQEVLEHDLTKKAIKVGVGSLKVFKFANMVKSLVISLVLYGLVFAAGWFSHGLFTN